MLRRSHNSDLYDRLTPRRIDEHVVVATAIHGNDIRNNNATTTSRTTTSDHPSSSSSSHRHDVVYRSLCDPDEIPDEARDVTWYDPFYKNDSNIIAAFDMDQRKIEEYMEASKIYYVLTFIFGLVTSLFFGWITGSMTIFFLVVDFNKKRNIHYQYRTAHLAIAHGGIYFDECDDTNQTLMKRTIIKYENIHDVVTTGYSFVHNGSKYFEVHIKNAEGKVTHLFYGFFAVQKFVDILKSMMESHRLSLDDTSTIDYNNDDDVNAIMNCNQNNNVVEREPLIAQAEVQEVFFDEQ
jgi:hypothetical protein